MLPSDVKDVSEIVHGLYIEASFLSCIKGPGLAPVYQEADDTCTVDSHLGVDCQIPVSPV